jgi:hypothetical protein
MKRRCVLSYGVGIAYLQALKSSGMKLMRINESMYFLPTPSTPPSEQLVTVSGGGGLG